jgi:hypothetical protein
VTYLAGVYLGQEERHGPLNVVAWWERDDDGKLVLHAVMTNLPATGRPKRLASVGCGSKRSFVIGKVAVFSSISVACLTRRGWCASFSCWRSGIYGW